MQGLTLALWIVTAIFGAYLFGTVSTRSRTGAPESGATHLPQLVLFLHPLTALGGLATYVAFLFTGEGVLAWVAFGLLVATAGLGDVMFLRTMRDRRRGDVGALAEQQLPLPVVLLHGTLGVTTLVLLLLVAL